MLNIKGFHIIDISKMCDLILISYSTKAPVSAISLNGYCIILIKIIC